MVYCFFHLHWDFKIWKIEISASWGFKMITNGRFKPLQVNTYLFFEANRNKLYLWYGYPYRVNDSLPTPKINSLPTPSHSQHQELTPNTKNQLTSNTKSTFRRRGRVDFPVSPLVLRRHFWNPIIYKHYRENDQHWSLLRSLLDSNHYLTQPFRVWLGGRDHST